MRSKLFVPGSRPELFAKAMAGEADALSFDLEDAVDESRKAEARRELAKFLRGLPANHGKTIIVRVNGLDTPHFEADLEAVVGPGLDIVNLPKCEGRDDVRACAAALTKFERKARVEPADIMPNIETPRALRLAAEIAAAAEHGTMIEINGNPNRRDLNEGHVRRAVAAGVRIVCNTDAHRIRTLGNMPYGVATARRAGLTADEVVNTRTWRSFNALRKPGRKLWCSRRAGPAAGQGCGGA